MSRHTKPWTFEPMEIWPVQAWEIYDPNLARVVATYYTQPEAEKALARINRKQAKKAARRAAR